MSVCVGVRKREREREGERERERKLYHQKSIRRSTTMSTLSTSIIGRYVEKNAQTIEEKKITKRREVGREKGMGMREREREKEISSKEHL